MLPWKLIADPNGYIFKWLLGYSGGLGSIAGVLVADYWFVRRKQLRLARSLSSRRRLRVRPGRLPRDRAYDRERRGAVPWRARFRRANACAIAGSGFNVAAIGATLFGCALAWIGLVVKPLAVLYDYAWFVGAGGAGLAYALLMLPERRRLARRLVTSSKL